MTCLGRDVLPSCMLSFLPRVVPVFASVLPCFVVAVAQYRQWSRICGVTPAQFFQEDTVALWLQQAK